MKYILIYNIFYKLTEKFDYFGKEELYIIIGNEEKNYKFFLNPLENNYWNYTNDILIPYNTSLNIKIYDKDISNDDVVLNEEFKIGGNNTINNLKIEYKLVDVIESKLYETEKIKFLSEINHLFNTNNSKDIVIKTLKEKVRDLNSCNRVFELKIKDILNKNKDLVSKITKIKNIINQS